MTTPSSVALYLYDSYVQSSDTARHWIQEAKKRADWFTDELMRDVFFCFYLERPEFVTAYPAPPFHRWFLDTMQKQFLYRLLHPRTIGQVNASFHTAIKAILWLTQTYAEEEQKRKRREQQKKGSAPVPAKGAGETKGKPGKAGTGDLGTQGSSSVSTKEKESLEDEEEGPMTMEMLLAFERKQQSGKPNREDESDRYDKPSPASQSQQEGRGLKQSSAERSKGSQAQEQSSLSEHLSKEQLEKLKLVGFTLQEGKRAAEQQQAAQESLPLTEAELEELKASIKQVQEDMRTQFMKRDKLKKKLGKLEEQLKRAEREREKLRKQEQELAAELEREMGEWLNEALKQSLQKQHDETLDLEELIKGSTRLANRKWGSELGRLRRQAFDQYTAWVEKLRQHPDLIAFLDEVGRSVKRIRSKQQERQQRQRPDAYDDFIQSGDIAHMLPSEATLLADPEFEPLFTMKWLEQKLMTYHTGVRQEDQGGGPVICMLDTSNSMRGGKLRLAQIFAATLASLCLLQRRDFALVLFGAKGEVLERQLRHGRPDWPAFYALSQLAFGGGTDFDAPILRGLDILRRSGRMKHADFVMITDGVGRLSEEAKSQLLGEAQAHLLRLHTLVVGDARQHLAHRYELIGVSHRLRFAQALQTDQPEAESILLDIFADEKPRAAPAKRTRK
ncbi:hypothetical protein [Paenibacillus turpanensis]|uniref:hypothetical protein n=1 Tax=Paenibacillus turpanensis TaxID=2689078 RepID=UPI00140723BC|nr:hypothetical protein [Paenibacillus turpanensis]